MKSWTKPEVHRSQKVSNKETNKYYRLTMKQWSIGSCDLPAVVVTIEAQAWGSTYLHGVSLWRALIWNFLSSTRVAWSNLKEHRWSDSPNQLQFQTIPEKRYQLLEKKALLESVNQMHNTFASLSMASDWHNGPVQKWAKYSQPYLRKAVLYFVLKSSESWTLEHLVTVIC